MNRLDIDRYIAELLETHDCVIVPDFGGFVGNYAKATINPVSHKFDPPFRKISFNKFLKHNDGLLASYFARKTNEQFEVSVGHLKDYAVLLREELETQKKVRFENIGVLHLRSDGSLQFEQLRDARFMKDSFGLDSFFAKTTVKERPAHSKIEPKSDVTKSPVTEERPKVVPIQSPEEDVSKEKSKRRILWPAAAAVLALPLIGYLIWVIVSTPLFQNNQDFHYSDLNPFTEKICPIYEKRIPSNFDNGESEKLLQGFEVVESEKIIEIFESEKRDKTLVVNLEEEKPKVATIENLPFHVIGGCFGELGNAQGLVNRFRTLGTNASIVERKGNLYRVSISSFATRVEAIRALDELRNKVPNAWILHK